MFRVYLFLLTILFSCYSVGGERGSTDSGSFGTGVYKEACYGDYFSMGLRQLGSSGNLIFTPAKGGRKKVLLENGTLLDPHYEVSSSQFIIREVTERDEGEFSYNLYGLSVNALTLNVKDCSDKVTRYYGSDYYLRVPHTAYLLEFTPLKGASDPPVLLWNRTDNPQVSEGGGRGRLVNNKWKMEKLTQEYNGYYTFRDKNHKFISRNKMTVEAQEHFLDSVEGRHVEIINFRMMGHDWFDLIFIPTNDPQSVLLMKAGDLLTNYYEWEMEEKIFAGRIRKIDERTLQIIIEDLHPSDSGHFKLMDQQGNLALIVELNVEEEDPPYFTYAGYAVGILLGLVLCCVRKCCKKTTTKNVSVRQTEAAPAVNYHDGSTQPSTSAHPSSLYGPTYSAPLCPKEPESAYHQPLVPGPENLHASSSQPEVEASTASPASTAFLGVDALSSDAGPRFELKGKLFASAPPLSSNTPYTDVYNSDKLL